MSSILKLFRVLFFLRALFFLLCMVAVVTVLQGWAVGAQMLFAFGLPIVLVWWQEKRRSRKMEAKVLAAESTNTRVTQSEPVARVNAHKKNVSNVSERELAKRMLFNHRRKRRPNHQNRTTRKSRVLASLLLQHFPQ